MFLDFQNQIQKAGESVISKTFYGITRSKMTCDNCKISKYSFQTFNMQIFQLKKLKQDKMKFEGNNNNFIKLNLFDAFKYTNMEEILDGENMIYCNNCRQLAPGFHKQDFYTLPPILIIILNRGKNNQDFNEEFRFDEILDFTDKNIVQNIESYKKYYLCGIITHLGESGSSGHFIAYCRNNQSENFVCYNDDSVCTVNTQDAMSAKISYEAMEKKTPYILLYHYLK
jgi:ubiquitin C-terminal hydrolase